MKSSWLTHVSAILLFTAGLGMLFLPDELLPMIQPDYPLSAAWVGQLMGSGWLALAALNWLNRGAVIGGIYQRPVVIANLTLYFISGGSLVPFAIRSDFQPTLTVACIVALVMAGAYAYALRKGPLANG
jgi:hypothetical protein